MHCSPPFLGLVYTLDMKCFLLLFLLSAAPLLAQNKASVSARTVYHTDGTFTESVQDLQLRTQTEHTYSARASNADAKTLIAKKVYLLNERNEPVQGNIYDGRDQLKARVQFFFDSFGRRSEQRMMNLRGEVYQRITFGYDEKGNPTTPRSQSYNVQSPDLKPAVVDFTQDAPVPMDRSQGISSPADQSIGFRGNVGKAPSSTTPPPIGVGADGQPLQSEEESKTEKKKSFWQKLGLGKKKE
jgi:hypothetical protein